MRALAVPIAYSALTMEPINDPGRNTLSDTVTTEKPNFFSDQTDEEVTLLSVVAKAQVWQAIGELARRGVPASDPLVIENGLEGALQSILFDAYLSRQWNSEHDVLQNIIDNGGRFVPPTSESADEAEEESK